jgi:hypothetical protein
MARGWALSGASNLALAEAVAPIAMQRPQPIEGNPSEILVAPQPPGCFRQQWPKQRLSPKGGFQTHLFRPRWVGR